MVQSKMAYMIHMHNCTLLFIGKVNGSKHEHHQ